MIALLEPEVLSEVDKTFTQILRPGQVLLVEEEAPSGIHPKEPLGTDVDVRLPVNKYRRLFSLPDQARKPHYWQEKDWLGLVTEISDDGFVARLRDYQGGPDLETTFLLQEIPPEDLELVQVGAEFYWSLGYRDDPNGQRQRYSLVHFRRLPKWTAKNLSDARQRALELLKELQLGADGSP